MTGEIDSNAPDDHDRILRLTPASTITPRPVKWLWDERIALGSLCLLAGREGIGKSSIAYALAAQITTGTMAGAYFGIPKSVIVAATEDSWAHTIVPRLMAAGADLDRVFRVDVTMLGGFDTEVTLPVDLGQLEQAVATVGAALILFDPLVSRLSASLDSHKDAEVRQALEPLTALADRSGASVLGIIHVNKSGGGDALNMIMGSRAFGAVARSVLFAMKSPDDESIKFLGQPKNNLGRDDLPTMTYRITGAHVADTPEGEVWTGKVEWLGESTQTIADALIASSDDPDSRTATRDAVEWLGDYLPSVGGSADSAIVKAAGKAVGHSERTLARARKQLRVVATSTGFPRTTHWSLPAAPDTPQHGQGITAVVPTPPPNGPGNGATPQVSASGAAYPLGDLPMAQQQHGRTARDASRASRATVPSLQGVRHDCEPSRDRDSAPLTDDEFASDDDEYPDVDVPRLMHPEDGAPPPPDTLFMDEEESA